MFFELRLVLYGNRHERIYCILDCTDKFTFSREDVHLASRRQQMHICFSALGIGCAQSYINIFYIQQIKFSKAKTSKPMHQLIDAQIRLLVRNDCLNFKGLCLSSSLRRKSRFRDEHKAIGWKGGMLAVHLLHPFDILPAATRSALEPNEDFMPIHFGLDTDVNLAFPAGASF